MKRLLAVEFAAVAALTLVVATGFGQVFSGRAYLGPIVGAAILPVLVAALGRTRRTSAASSLLWSVVGFLLYAVYAALGDTAPNIVPTTASLRELASGLTQGWADLLTMSLPVPVQPRLLVSVLALTWAASAIGSEFAHRSRSSAAPVVPALLLEVAVLGFAAPRPTASIWPAAGLTVAVLVVLLVHANRATVLERNRRGDDDGDDAADEVAFDALRPVSVDRSAERWTLLGLPVVAVTVLITGLAVTRLPSVRDPFDPRRLRDQQVVAVDAPNPLDGLKAELTLTPEAPPIRFRFSADDNPDSPDAVDRLRLTVLDRFDGAGWSSSEAYTRTGPTLPAAKGNPDGTVRVTQQVTIEALGGPWLPAADRPVGLVFAGPTPELAVDDATGVVILTDGALDGLSYTVVSEKPRRSRAGTDTAARAVPADEVSALTAVPGMPVALRQLAQRLAEPTSADTSDLARLTRLQDALAGTYGYSESVPSGSSYARLSRFLDKDRAGYAEQFASAFAVMARSLGHPTRLVYGYLVTESDRGIGSQKRLTSITSRQAHVWPEVLLADGVWVPFEPTPPHNATAAPRSDSSADDARSTGLVTGEATAAGSGTAGTGGGEAGGERVADHALLSTPALALYTVLATVVLLIGSLLAVKRLRRRRRRRAPSTAEQVLGAWAEVTDRLLEVGVDVDPAMTAREVVAVSAPVVSAPATERLGAMVPHVTVALYSPEPPTTSGAAEMWDLADRFSDEVLDGRPWYGGIVARLNPRPLLGTRKRR